MTDTASNKALPGGYAAVFALTFTLQFLLVAYSLPLGELLSPTPLLHIDAAHHWYQIKLAVDLAAEGKLVGYDPTFAAGYLGGVPYNTSAKFQAAIAALSGGRISPAVAFKLFGFAAAIVGPLTIPLAARRLGLDARSGALAALLTLILWWASPIHWYVTSGIVAWPLVALLSTWFAALLADCASGRAGTAGFVGATVLGAILFFAHPLFPLAVSFALFALLLLNARRIAPRRLAAVLVLVPAICIAANLPWILAMRQAAGMADGAQPYQQAVDIHMVWQDMLGLPSKGRGAKFYAVLVFFALWGIFATRERGLKRLALALSLAALATLLFADLGSAIRAVALVQPNRFSFQAYILLLLPAALGLRALLHGLGHRSSAPRGVARGFVVAGAVVGAAGLAYGLNEVRRELLPGAQGHYGFAPPEVREPGPLTDWTLAQLRDHTDPGARVMFELSHARIHDAAHIAGYLAVQSQREFIGGAYPYTHFANAWDGWAFGHPLADLPAARFREYLALYNVGWIVAHSDELKAYVAKLPDVVPMASSGPLSMYRVGVEHSFFIEGRGKVTGRGANRIELSDLEGDVVVLKYHHVPGMRSEPAAQVDGVRLLDDPQPFIRITRPPPSLRLSIP